MMVEMLEVDQGIAFLETLASSFDEDINLTSDLQIRPGGLIGTRTLNKEDVISNLLVQLLKFAISAFKMKMMECCPKSYDINLR